MIGVDTREDVETLDLDKTFEDMPGTQTFLESMLNSMGKTVNIESVTEGYISPDARQALTIASGGVPRDYLTILQKAIDVARSAGQGRKWLTPTDVWVAASDQFKGKLDNLRGDNGTDAGPLERIFRDLMSFCLKEKHKTAFLVSKQEIQDYPVEHEFIQQLMDFKLIHIIDTNTSAASSRAGRFEAYTLDFSLFMSPRLRGIEHVEFWKTDANRRREGVREAPIYPFSRVRAVLTAADAGSTELAVNTLEHEIGVEETGASSQYGFHGAPPGNQLSQKGGGA